jgi:hypothetical protein
MGRVRHAQTRQLGREHIKVVLAVHMASKSEDQREKKSVRETTKETLVPREAKKGKSQLFKEAYDQARVRKVEQARRKRLL